MKLRHLLHHEASKESVFSPNRKREQIATRTIDQEIKRAMVELDPFPDRHDAFLRLVRVVRVHTKFLQPTRTVGVPACATALFFVRRLRNLASRCAFWFEPCETWRPNSAQLRPAFHSLAQHLFAGYPTPPFMDSVWDLPPGQEAFCQQAWYIQVSCGASFRTLQLPVTLSRRMEHHTRAAPDHFTVLQALRYGEARGLGSTEAMARALSQTRLGAETHHPDFWRTVLIFLAAHPELAAKQVGAIIEFIHASKFAAEEIVTADGRELRDPPCPEFSIHGRTVNSLLRLVSLWQPDLDCPAGFSWPSLGIKPFRFLHRDASGKEHHFAIVELLNSGTLYAEGKAMNHCVFTYAEKCRCGHASIWSLRARTAAGEKRLVTIEIDPHSHTIVQAQAPRNGWLRSASRRIIRQWAHSEGLAINLL